MIELLTDTTFGKWIATMVVSMVPVIELRGGIPYGVGFGMPYWQAFIAAFIGNMLPIPFILILIHRFFNWLKKHKKTKNFVERMEKRAHLKGQKVIKYRLWGLFILVAVPLPGTGAWTGALVASVLDIRMKHAFPVIALGVITAGLIVMFVTQGVVKMI